MQTWVKFGAGAFAASSRASSALADMTGDFGSIGTVVAGQTLPMLYNLDTLEPPKRVQKLFHGSTPPPAPRTGTSDPIRLPGPVNGSHAHAGHVPVTAVVSSCRNGNAR